MNMDKSKLGSLLTDIKIKKNGPIGLKSLDNEKADESLEIKIDKEKFAFSFDFDKPKSSKKRKKKEKKKLTAPSVNTSLICETTDTYDHVNLIEDLHKDVDEIKQLVDNMQVDGSPVLCVSNEMCHKEFDDSILSPKLDYYEQTSVSDLHGCSPKEISSVNEFDIDIIIDSKSQAARKSSIGSKNIDVKTTSKKPAKKKKVKKKSQTATAYQEDIDSFLDKEIQNNKIKSQSQMSTYSHAVKNTSSDDKLRFLSPKDPEITQSQKDLLKFGNAKNLVAIGPPKIRSSRDKWLGNNGETSTLAISSDEIVSSNSPFSFGFEPFI